MVSRADTLQHSHCIVAWTDKVSFVIYLRYNKKEKKKELDIIQQGIRLPKPLMVSSQPLPAASAKPASLPTVNFPATLTQTLPDNTAGQANVRGNSAPPPAISVNAAQSPAPLPIQSASYPILIMPSVEGGAAVIAHSQSQFYYIKRKQDKELSGVKSRKYTRSANPIVCGTCGQPRDASLHKQYFGNWYCKSTQTETFEEWRENFKSKGYGKKKKTDK